MADATTQSPENEITFPFPDLEEHFSTMTAKTHRQSVVWNLAGLLILVAASVVLYSLLHSVKDATGSALALKFGVTIPAAIAAAACFREAAVWRDHSLWARHMAAQLATAQKYGTLLQGNVGSAEMAGNFLRNLGNVISAGPPEFAFSARVRSKGKAKNDDAVPLALIQPVADALGAAMGGAKKHE